MIQTIVILAIAAGLTYLLYINGYLVLQSKRAVMFVGSMRGCKATFSSCTGYLKRVTKFESDGVRTFTLDAELTKGEMWVELLDADKNEILRLDSKNTSAAIAVESRKRYYLVFRFESASGKYLLSSD